MFAETASFWRNFDFFAFLRFLGGSGHLCFFGDPKTAKIPKYWVWGPVEGVSANFSGDLKVAHGDSATDEPKNTDFEPLSPIYGQNTCLCARWQWGLCLGT